MSAEAVGRHMPAVASLDDLAAMMAADPHGHRYWTVDRDAGQTVTMHRLAAGGYQIMATTPLSWVLNTAPEDHLG